LDKRFVRAALRASENLPGPISLFFKTAKHASSEQFSFEKLAAQCLPLLKAGQGKFASSEFLLAYSKLLMLIAKNLLIQFKITDTAKKLYICLTLSFPRPFEPYH
jgi:hypothetical protein